MAGVYQPYKFLVCRASGEVIDEGREAHARGITQTVNSFATAKLTLGLRDRLAYDLNPGARLKVLRERFAWEDTSEPELVFYGLLPAPNIDERGDADQVEATFVDPRWVWTRRYNTGAETWGDPSPSVPQAQIIHDLNEGLAARTNGNSWIKRGANPTTMPRDRSYPDRKLISEIIADLTNVIGGPDVGFTPVDYWRIDRSRYMGTVDVYDRQGADRTADVHFVYGEGLPSNVVDMQRTYVDITNRAEFEGNTTDDPPVAIVGTADLSTSYYGVLEHVESVPDVSIQQTLDDKAWGVVTEYNSPVELITVGTPTSEAPPVFASYGLGDTVALTARKGRLNFARRPARIYGIDVQIDQDGESKVTLTTASNTDSSPS